MKSPTLANFNDKLFRPMHISV